MGRRGRKRRLLLEDEYWRLIQSGIGTVEACRCVGIGRKTGYRWREERGGIAPVRLAEEQRSGRYFCLLDRHRIATLRARGESIRVDTRDRPRSRAGAIDGQPGAAPQPHAPRSRRLRRRSGARSRTHPRRTAEARQAAARRRAAPPRRGASRPGLVAGADRRLAASHAPREDALTPLPRDDLPGPLRTSPFRAFAHAHDAPAHRQAAAPPAANATGAHAALQGSRAAQRRALASGGGPPAHRRLGGGPHLRPQGTTAIGTLVDRHSRLVRLVHQPRGHGAFEVRDALRAVFEAMAVEERRTLTWDQGPEMAAHDGIDELFDEGVYFAHPGAPWQRGTNENTNRLLRQYFPKGSDLSVHSSRALMAVEAQLNQRPRKLLGWRTPAGPRGCDSVAKRLSVATIPRIHPRTHRSHRGQLWTVIDNGEASVAPTEQLGDRKPCLCEAAVRRRGGTPAFAGLSRADLTTAV